jgi:hypothetical protein
MKYDRYAVMTGGEKPAGGQPENGEERQQISIQLIHQHAIGCVHHSDAGIMPNLGKQKLLCDTEDNTAFSFYYVRSD